MAVDLGIDSLIQRIRSVDTNSTGFADAVNAFVSSFLSTTNRFNSAATRDVGTEAGNIPELNADGDLPRSVLPQATTTQAGAVRFGTDSEHQLVSPPSNLAATPSGVAALLNSRSGDTLLPGFGQTLPGTYTWNFAPLGRAALVFLTGGGGGASFDRANGGGGAGATAVGLLLSSVATSYSVTIGAGGRAGIFDTSPDPDDERDTGVGPENNGLPGGDSFITASLSGTTTRILTATGGRGSSGSADDSQGGSVSTNNRAGSLLMGFPGGDGQPNLRFLGGASYWGGAGKAPGAGGYLTIAGRAGCVLILQFG